MSKQAGLKVCVVGLGSMGMGVATSLVRGGFETIGCDVSHDAMTRFVASGGTAIGNPAEAARGADVVITVVVNAAQTEAVLFGDEGAAGVMKKGASCSPSRRWGRTWPAALKSASKPSGSAISTPRSAVGPAGLLPAS